jgi:hypothetical protein
METESDQSPKERKAGSIASGSFPLNQEHEALKAQSGLSGRVIYSRNKKMKETAPELATIAPALTQQSEENSPFILQPK